MIKCCYQHWTEGKQVCGKMAVYECEECGDGYCGKHGDEEEECGRCQPPLLIAIK